MNRKGLVLIDLDKTLINESYNLTDERIFEVIEEKKREGWLIGLNSDTPLKPLRIWYNLLEMNGYIISENGALIVSPGGKEIILSDSISLFAEIKQNVVLNLISDSEVELFIGDATAFVKTVKNISSCLSVLVAINSLRKYSFSFFVRRIEAGELCRDLDIFCKIVEGVRVLLPSKGIREGLGKEYCIFVLSPLDCDKSKAVSFLSGKYNRIVMIGDSEADYCQGVENMAVGNAKLALKEKAVYVATREYTSGVIEILERL